MTTLTLAILFLVTALAWSGAAYLASARAAHARTRRMRQSSTRSLSVSGR